MKVRIGVALGSHAELSPDGFGAVLDALDRHGFDSIWLSDTFLAPTLDPLVGLSYAAARVRRLKLGTHVVLPARNPVRLARALAQLDRLSEGRLLLNGVVGLDDQRERAAQGRPTGDRGAEIDVVLPLLRRLWAGEVVDHAAHGVVVEQVALPTLPVQQPLEVWLGGTAPRALRRVGRLGDGWLPSLLSVAEAVDGRAVVEAEAEAAGRAISAEHFGMNLAYARGEPDGDATAAIARRAKGRDVSDAVLAGPAALRAAIGRWVDAGFSKFVVRPLSAPASWERELDDLAADVLDLQRSV